MKTQPFVKSKSSQPCLSLSAGCGCWGRRSIATLCLRVWTNRSRLVALESGVCAFAHCSLTQVPTFCVIPSGSLMDPRTRALSSSVSQNLHIACCASCSLLPSASCTLLPSCAVCLDARFALAMPPARLHDLFPAPDIRVSPFFLSFSVLRIFKKLRPVLSSYSLSLLILVSGDLSGQFQFIFLPSTRVWQSLLSPLRASGIPMRGSNLGLALHSHLWSGCPWLSLHKASTLNLWSRAGVPFRSLTEPTSLAPCDLCQNVVSYRVRLLASHGVIVEHFGRQVVHPPIQRGPDDLTVYPL